MAMRAEEDGDLFHLDPRDTPVYSLDEVAGYVGVPRSTLRHWLKAAANGRAVIERPDPENVRLSFYNLLEAHVLRVALEKRAWLHRVRDAVETLRERHPQERHPLLSQDLYTAGDYRNIFAKTLAGDVEDLSRGGQLGFRSIFSRLLERIDRDRSGPYQLRPYRFQHVAINHRVSGGRPVVKGTGILVKVLASRAAAGESPEDLARNYNLSKADVREAIKYAAA